MDRSETIRRLREVSNFIGRSVSGGALRWEYYPLDAVRNDWASLRKRGLVSIKAVSRFDRHRITKYPGHEVRLTDKGRDYLWRFGGSTDPHTEYLFRQHASHIRDAARRA